MKKLIIVGIGIALLGGAYLISKQLEESKKLPTQRVNKIEKTVFIQKVKNTVVPINITAYGNLVAKNKVDIYSEVQGVLQFARKDFKAGVSYDKGQALLKINNQEFYASIQSKRSSLQSLIASIIPDIRLDYAGSFQQWNKYLQNFEINSPVLKLPKPLSEKEKYFITGKNIYTTYFNIKTLEVRLEKYTIKAPFDGILTETLVTNGTLVRVGQKMGEYIDSSIFELTLAVNGAFADLLKTGKKVALQNLEKNKTWLGKIVRINGRIDQASQTVQVFIEVKAADLREGMYLEANLPAKKVKGAIEINRKLLIENKAVYVVKNNMLSLVTIVPIHFNENTVVITGLNDGMQLMSNPVTGVYEGMPVKIFSENLTIKKK